MLVNNSNNNSNTIFYRHFSPSSTQYVAILCTACVLCLWWWESLWVNMFCNGWNSRVKYIDINMRRIPHRGRARAFIKFYFEKDIFASHKSCKSWFRKNILCRHLRFWIHRYTVLLRYFMHIPLLPHPTRVYSCLHLDGKCRDNECLLPKGTSKEIKLLEICLRMPP